MTMLFRASPIRPFRLIPVAALLFAASTLAVAQDAPKKRMPADAKRTATEQSTPDTGPLQLPTTTTGWRICTKRWRSTRGDRTTRRRRWKSTSAGAGRRSELVAAARWAGGSLFQDRTHQGCGDGCTGAGEASSGRCAGAHAAGAGVSAIAGRHGAGAQQSGRDAATWRLRNNETIGRLKPGDLEAKLLLGQLYALNHDSAKAEAAFKTAQKIDADSEDVVLNMARLYGAEWRHAARGGHAGGGAAGGPRRHGWRLALGAILRPVEEAEGSGGGVSSRSLDLEPENPDAEHGLANALLADDQLVEALKVLNALVAADPTDGNVGDSHRRDSTPPGPLRRGTGNAGKGEDAGAG